MELDVIYNEDCYEAIKKIPDKSIDLIVTDPPYEIEGIHGSGIMKHRYETADVCHAREILENDLHKGIDLKILNEYVRVLKKINIYIWCNKEQIYDYMTYFVKERNCNFEILIWAKENPTPFCGTHYLKDKEYCLYFWEQGAPVNIPFDRARTYLISKTNREDKEKYNHPTVKPIEFIKKLILNSSGGGLLIFDPFVGSGTVCAAAKELGRQFIGFELNPTFYQIAVDRMNGVDQNGVIDLFDSIEDSYEQGSLFDEIDEEDK